MAILEARVFQTFFNQQCVNTFHYQTNSVPASVSLSLALTAAMGFVVGIPPSPAGLYGAWKTLVAEAVTFTEVEVKNVYDVTDFYVLPLSSNNTGAAISTPLSPTMAYGLQSSRTRTDIRRGNRRLVGVVEGANQDGGVLGQGTIDNIQAVASEMQADLSYVDEGNPLTFSPIIVSKEKYVTPNGTEAYRYYQTLAEQEAHVMSSVIWNAVPTIRTQTSRQYGRGV